jgi:hypothetical protein
MVVLFNYLQWYGFWLNKGSSFILIYNVKESQEDSLVLAIVRGEKAVIFFEFVWRQSIQSWYPCTVLVDSQLVDAVAENSNDKVYPLWKIHVIYYWEMNAIWFTVGGEDSYQEWTKYPSNAQLVSAWKLISGKTFIQEVS